MYREKKIYLWFDDGQTFGKNNNVQHRFRVA